MQYKNQSRHIFMLICSACLMFFTAGTNVYAEETSNSSDSATSSDPALEITPVSRRMLLNSGEEKSGTLTAKNISDSPLTISVYATPYSSADDGNTQNLDTETTYTQIARWITIKTDEGAYAANAAFAVAPGESKEIEYKVTVPESAPSGGQYATLFVEIKPETSGEGLIQTISRAGMVIYASVTGETQRVAHISDIEANMTAIGKNIGIRFTVTNNGNIDFQASTEISVSSVFGKELFRNTTLSAILPENSKTIVAEWGDTPAFGIYHLSYTIDALDIHADGSLYVLVLAPIFLGLFVVVTTLAIIAIVYLIKHHTIDKDADLIIN